MNLNKILLAMIPLLALFVVSACDNSGGDGGSITPEKRDAIEKDFSNVFKVKISDSETWNYYLGADGKRYIFPTEGTFKSWFGNREVTVEKTLEEVGEITIGGNVTYKPGTRLITTESVAEVFYVAPGGILRPINSTLAEKLYGVNWKDMIDDLENHYFTNYKIGTALTSEEEVSVINDDWSINDDKNLF
jgi:hypothetical protein